MASNRKIADHKLAGLCISYGFTGSYTEACIYDLQEWLRTSYQIYIEVLIDKTCEPKYGFIISRFIGDPNDLSKKEWYWDLFLEHKYSNEFFPLLYRTYEEALTEGIIESIKVIDNDKILQSL